MVLASLTIALPAYAQNWSSIGDFYSAQCAPSKIWYDSIADRCYIAGGYSWFDSSEIHAFGYVSGDTIIGLGCGFEIACGTNVSDVHDYLAYVLGFANFQGSLYATGDFTMAGGNPAVGIARWSGNDWVSIGSGLNYYGVPGIGCGLKVMNDELYVFGIFDSINGINANSLAKFDGQNWSPVFNMPEFSPGNLNFIYDVQWYKNELYVGGNFFQPGTNPPVTDLAKWNGNAWVAVGNGITGGFNSITKLVSFQNKLIIAGGFTRVKNPGSIPGNNITIWDGITWDTLGGGLFYNSGGLVYDVIIHDGDIYVIGGFNTAGGIPVSNIAKWDGMRWCGTKDTFDIELRTIGFHDDTLFVASNFWTINGDSSLQFLAKWVGPFGDTCQIVSTDPRIVSIDISIFPNPVTDRLYIRSEAGIIYEANIYDIHGRKTGTGTGNAKEMKINFENILPGIYVVEVKTGEGMIRKKVVRRGGE